MSKPAQELEAVLLASTRMDLYTELEALLRKYNPTLGEWLTANDIQAFGAFHASQAEDTPVAGTQEVLDQGSTGLDEADLDTGHD